mgnify:CR=1 FL=1
MMTEPGEAGDRGEAFDPFRYLEERFGIPAEPLRERYRVFQQGGKQAFLVSRDLQLPEELEVSFRGLSFMRLRSKPPKPTTDAVLAFGHMATRNVVSLSDTQLSAYVSRTAGLIPPEQLESCDGGGHVIVRHRHISIGLGRLLAPTSAAAQEISDLDASTAPAGSRILESWYPKRFARG